MTRRIEKGICVSRLWSCRVTAILLSVALMLLCLQDVSALEHLTQWPAVQCRPVDCRYEMNIIVSTPSDSSVANPVATVTQRLLYQNTTREPIRFLNFIGPQPVSVTAAGGHALVISEPDDKGLWRVKLNRPLEPNGITQLSMQFDVTFQDPRYGFEYRELSGVWHPKVVDAVASGASEGLNAAIASYDASVLIPKGWKCVTSGLRREQQSSEGKEVLRFAVDHIAEFAVVLTRELQSIKRKVGGVSIELLYRSERKEQAKQMADLAVDVVEFYSEEFGFYPQPYLCIVMLGWGFGGGPVGGNIVRVNDSIDKSLPQTAWGVAHEIGHEYWGFECVVESDHIAKWFGLGMGIHSDQAYCRSRGWNVSQHANMKYDYLSAVRKGRDTTLICQPPRPVGGKIVHGKGFVIVELLHYVLGEEKFNKAVRDFLTTYRYKRVPQDIIQAVFQKHAQEDLTEFFHGWLKTNGTLDYGIKEVTSEKAEGKFQITVILECQGALQLSLPVEIALIDGARLKKGSTLASNKVQFHAAVDWYSATLDPDVVLPDANRANNTILNPEAPSVFEISEIDIGDVAWGRNVLRVKVKNTSDRKQKFWLHIGGKYRESGHPAGFGMGPEKPLVFAPSEERQIEHPYWVPPQPGKLTFRVEFVMPAGSARPSEQDPFLVKKYSVTFETPNTKCNELTILPVFIRKYDLYAKYRDGTRIPAFVHFETEHFVFYCSPGTPAHQDIEKIKAHREKVLAEVRTFLGVSFEPKISCFFFPDAADKFTCFMHHGDGLAFDNTIVEIYNDKTKLDPYHELTHIVAGRIGNPPALLNEGLAVYMQAGHKWKGVPVDVTASKLLEEGKLTPLGELIKRTEIGSRGDDGKVAYPQSASFVKFLIDKYGKDKFLKAYKTLRNSGDKGVQQQNKSELARIYGKNLRELENEWHGYLEERD